MTDDWVSADEGPAEVPQQRGIWTASQKICIRSFAEEWNNEAADRKLILPKIVTALLALSEPPTVQNMGSQVKSYLSNNCRRLKETKVGRKPSVRTVIQFTRRKTLDKEAKKRNGPEKSTYLGTHSKVVSEAIKALTEPERAEIESIRTEWENKGPPPRARREAAEKTVARRIHDFSRQMYLECGARIAMYAAYVKVNGEKTWGFFDHNDEFGVAKPSFKSYFKDYDIEKTATQFKGFTADHLTSCSENDGDNSEESTGADASKTRKLAKGRHSYLLLPKGIGNVSVLPRHVLTARHPSQIRQHLKWQKSIIRAMVTDMYNVASGRERGPCPWKAITVNPDAFIDQSVYMPTMVKMDSVGIQGLVPVQLQDPSKMQQDGIRRILHHWTERQNQGLVPFAFSNVLRTGDMVPALPLDVPPQALLPLSGQKPVENVNDTITEGHTDTSQPFCSETPNRPSPTPIVISHGYPSPAPTTPPGDASPPPPPGFVTPVTRSPSPMLNASGLEDLVQAPNDIAPSAPKMFLGPVNADPLNTSVIDPCIPQLTEAQLLVTGPLAFTTNSLAGARIGIHSESPLQIMHTEVPLSDSNNPLNDPNLFRHFAEYMRLHGSTRPPNPPVVEVVTPSPGPIKRKRGRPRKSLVTSEGNGNTSPPKKRHRQQTNLAPSSSSSEIVAMSAPNGPPLTTRPTPRPVAKKSTNKIDLANVAPYDGLITRRMAAERHEDVVGNPGLRKGKGKEKGN